MQTNDGAKGRRLVSLSAAWRTPEIHAYAAWGRLGAQYSVLGFLKGIDSLYDRCELH
jgi:hypothetical protein